MINVPIARLYGQCRLLLGRERNPILYRSPSGAQILAVHNTTPHLSGNLRAWRRHGPLGVPYWGYTLWGGGRGILGDGYIIPVKLEGEKVSAFHGHIAVRNGHHKM